MRTYLEKQHAAKNVFRYYHMEVAPNLFGEWTLHREWGRIGQGGRTRMDWFTSKDQAEAALITQEALKRKRGYWVEPQQLALLR